MGTMPQGLNELCRHQAKTTPAPNPRPLPKNKVLPLRKIFPPLFMSLGHPSSLGQQHVV